MARARQYLLSPLAWAGRVANSYRQVTLNDPSVEIHSRWLETTHGCRGFVGLLGHRFVLQSYRNRW
jgi:hypothetical protein